ncbi:amidohydrolase [Acinetobacter courvalinii]|uniref:Amidohydrolase n=1 Tax=Acinetobacter courvalinii TaxID=280147 RepID=N9RG72_9GAMM|nr:amidohydrolase [Acinetobacter courvalinii]ENX37610.1 hypothetical protein F888_02951 [Acinetobacter courvalinii]KAB0658949.1 amidohydrolase [Acinetobacter courvalinii]GGH26303.1 amidohydrolase [Acinetobacter courvalinii]
MKKFLISSSLALFSIGVYAADEPADIIFTNGEIYTPNGWVESLAVREGIILAIGNNKEIASYRGNNSKILDLKGASVFPGLHDMHVHPTSAGVEQFTCSLPYRATPTEILSQVSKCVQKAKPGEWIIGGNWSSSAFKPGQQTREFLDKVSPNNPVLLADEAHHTQWANSKAIEAVGINKYTKDPVGGVIERDKKGYPNGIFRENAALYIDQRRPVTSDELLRKGLELSTQQMLSYGITSFTDAEVRMPEIRTLSALSKEGLIKQRVRACIVWSPLEGEQLILKRNKYVTERLKTDCVKIFVDGVPTEGMTAAMLQPYEGHKHNKGIFMMPLEVMDSGVAKYDRMGLTIKFHAIGDAAVKASIDAVEKARKKNGWMGASHQLGHGSFVTFKDIPRVRDLHMTWEFSPYAWYPNPIVDIDVRHNVGEKRMERAIPIREAVETGANVIAGSDWPVIPSVNPWPAIETMVTRQEPGGSYKKLAPAQQITLEQALRIFTANAAAAMGNSDQIGSIEPGKRADIIVTESNPFKVPVTEIHKTKVIKTFIDGELVYDSANPSNSIAE